MQRWQAVTGLPSPFNRLSPLTVTGFTVTVFTGHVHRFHRSSPVFIGHFHRFHLSLSPVTFTVFTGLHRSFSPVLPVFTGHFYRSPSPASIAQYDYDIESIGIVGISFD